MTSLSRPWIAVFVLPNMMRHRLIRGLQWSWHNIIYDALPVKVYLFPELFAPCCNLYIIQPRPTNNLDSLSLILIWKCVKI